VLSVAYERSDGKAPQPGELDAEDRALLQRVETGFQTVGDLCNASSALGEALALAPDANGYLDRKAPWFQIKEDRQAAATTAYVILRVVDNPTPILSPILPHTRQKLHEYLGHDGRIFGPQHVVEYREETRSHQAVTCNHSGAIGTWAPSELPPAQALRQPAPPFKKLDESAVEQGHVRLRSQPHTEDRQERGHVSSNSELPYLGRLTVPHGFALYSLGS
jgi:methionyl-tRNA synthetase